jgi:cellulose synthase/poly-beta-1,6-N-acetylglucosamine synthase-like glycosyltransferase
VIKRVLNLAANVVISILLLFVVRRWLFIIFAWLPTRPESTATSFEWPEVLLLVPFRNEAEALSSLLSSLAALTYPKPDRLTVVLIDDGSTDSSQQVIRPWLAAQKNWHLLPLARNVGKAQALNQALEHFPQGAIIAIYDADERPRVDALERLVSLFADQTVGGVSGRRAVSNAQASPAASYATFEGLVHQLVTMQAKDRLNLAPAMLGANCAYRRAAWQSVAGFKPGALLEDSDLTLKLAQAGWQTRFAPQAVSYHQVPESLSGYWQQHVRWARGFNEVAKDQAGSILFDRRLSWLMRLELLLFSLGYLDRIGLMGALILSTLNRTRRLQLLGVVALNLVTPLVQIMTALAMARQSKAMWARLGWVPLFFVIDLVMAVTGLWTTVRNLPQIWEERSARK